MIETETTCTITCDVCGKTIGEGEQWYSVTHSVTTSVFAGAIANLEPVSELSLELCQADYDASQAQLAKLAPTAQRHGPPPSLVPPAA